jgi:hypothetical protein
MNAEFFEAMRRVVEQGAARRIPGAGLDLKDEIAGIDSPDLKPVSGLFLSPGPSEKIWTAHWDYVRGAEYYEVQTNPNPARSWGWSESSRVEDLSAVVRRSPTDRRLWVRVRAVNAWRRGPWSDPISVSDAARADQTAESGIAEAA